MGAFMCLPMAALLDQPTNQTALYRCCWLCSYYLVGRKKEKISSGKQMVIIDKKDATKAYDNPAKIKYGRRHCRVVIHVALADAANQRVSCAASQGDTWAHGSELSIQQHHLQQVRRVRAEPLEQSQPAPRRHLLGSLVMSITSRNLSIYQWLAISQSDASVSREYCK